MKYAEWHVFQGVLRHLADLHMTSPRSRHFPCFGDDIPFTDETTVRGQGGGTQQQHSSTEMLHASSLLEAAQAGKARSFRSLRELSELDQAFKATSSLMHTYHSHNTTPLSWHAFKTRSSRIGPPPVGPRSPPEPPTPPPPKNALVRSIIVVTITCSLFLNTPRRLTYSHLHHEARRRGLG